MKAPTYAFEIQEHEVTYEELGALALQGGKKAPWVPAWVPEDPTQRAKLPVTGIAWDVAAAFCKGQGGDLPSEEEWEWAARGASLRVHPWGGAPVDPTQTRVYARPSSVAVNAVKSNPQDQSPEGLFDLAGNAQEWTRDLYRDDAKPSDDWQPDPSSDVVYRAIRGLPIDDAQPESFPAGAALFRARRCAQGGCSPAALQARAFIGFRCMKR